MHDDEDSQQLPSSLLATFARAVTKTQRRKGLVRWGYERVGAVLPISLACLAPFAAWRLSTVQVAAKRVAQAVETAWQAYLRGEVATQTRGQTLPHTMHQFVMVELPAKVADPQAWPAIAREMRIFNMLGVVAS